MKNILKVNNRYHFLSGFIAYVTSIFFFLEVYAIQKLIYIAEGNADNIINNIIFILCVFISGYTLYYFKLRIFNKTEYVNKKQLITLYFDSVFKHNIRSFNEYNIYSEANTMINNNFDIVNKYYYSAIYDLIYGFTFVTFGLIYLVYLSWEIALISTIFFLISFAIVKVFSILNDKFHALRIKTLKELLNISKELYNSSLHLIIYNSLDGAIDYVKEHILGYSRNATKLNISEQIFSITNDAISGYREYIVLFFIFYYSKIIDLNIIFVIIYLSTNISVPFNRLTNYINTIRSSKTIRTNIIKSILDIKEDEANIKINNIEKIELKNIGKQFEEKVVLEDFNYVFSNNNKYLITGESGYGKSTLLDIILGINKPSIGEVYINDKLLKRENMIFGSYSYISQNEILFDSSIKENIVLFNDNYDKSKYVKILSILNIKLNDNIIIDNANLNISGGELQKILLARSLYHNHKLIVLDEAFSALDKNSLYELEDIVLNLESVMILNVGHYTAESNKFRYDHIIELKNDLDKGCLLRN